MTLRKTILLMLPLVSAAAADYRAGAASVDITPAEPIWLSGYAARSRPSEGVILPLHAKALAIEDSKRSRFVLVTTDLIGLPRAITDLVSARAQKQYGLERSRILFNSSHTHTGPVVKPNLMTMFNLDEQQSRVVDTYARKLGEDLFTVIGAAISRLEPASLSYGTGTTTFAVNRRVRGPKGFVIAVNPDGPVDHRVPVLKVTAADGTLRAVLFAYACHNTTLTAEFNKVSGDYAGFAQAEVEKAYPGATALFMMLCGGDQNPNPRSAPDLAEKHGRSLAVEVRRVVDGKLEPVTGRLQTAFVLTELPFAPHTRETFEEETRSDNRFRVARAKSMLRAYDERRPIRSTPYPVQAIRFGKGLTILGLGGEVVVDYTLRARKEYGEDRLIVAGYCNDVMCYIPSLRVLKEGGYEAVESMVYYGQPGPFNEEVEERVFAAVAKVLARVGRK